MTYNEVMPLTTLVRRLDIADVVYNGLSQMSWDGPMRDALVEETEKVLLMSGHKCGTKIGFSRNLMPVFEHMFRKKRSRRLGTLIGQGYELQCLKHLENPLTIDSATGIINATRRSYMELSGGTALTMQTDVWGHSGLSVGNLAGYLLRCQFPSHR